MNLSFCSEENNVIYRLLNHNNMNILITGGAGYVGSVLTPKLLNCGHNVKVIDLMIYGSDVIESHKNLKKIKGDIRDKNLLKKNLENIDVVIHLACISNDPSFELNPDLGRSINLDSFEPLVKLSIEKKVKRFIYASSSSVYGLKSESNVHEEMSLEPLTDYSKYKAECEKILAKYSSDTFVTTTLRPATVCGYSPRQRLDVVVNILTNLAYHKREISVFGGDQFRPNIHIKDMVDSYLTLIDAPSKLINNQIFNVGFENKTVSELANLVKENVGDDVKLKIVDSDDNRSYHISSNKIQKILNFKPKFKISDAILELREAFKNDLLPNSLHDEKYFNIKTMQKINLE